MLSLKGDLDKKTKGTLDKNTAILENLVTKLRIWGVLETNITPRAFRSLRARSNSVKIKKENGQGWE